MGSAAEGVCLDQMSLLSPFISPFVSDEALEWMKPTNQHLVFVTAQKLIQLHDSRCCVIIGVAVASDCSSIVAMKQINGCGGI